MWRLHPRVLLGAGWALLAVVSVRRRLRRDGVRARVPSAPRLAAPADRGVDAVLHRLSPSCLERALVRQAWLATRIEDVPDVVIGLPPKDFGPTPAHAWLDGTDQASAATYIELHRLPALRRAGTPNRKENHTGRRRKTTAVGSRSNTDELPEKNQPFGRAVTTAYSSAQPADSEGRG